MINVDELANSQAWVGPEKNWPKGFVAWPSINTYFFFATKAIKSKSYAFSMDDAILLA